MCACAIVSEPLIHSSELQGMFSFLLHYDLFILFIDLFTYLLSYSLFRFCISSYQSSREKCALINILTVLTYVKVCIHSLNSYHTLVVH